jgi:hypothetical protein
MSTEYILLSKLRDLLGDKIFYLFTKDVKIVFGNKNNIKSLGGFYYRDIKTLVLYSKKIDVLLHELGHHVFFHPKYGRYFKFKYLWEAFRKYQNKQYSRIILSTYQAETSLAEFFSEIFAFYFMYPDILVEEDPILYKELTNALKNIISNFYQNNNNKIIQAIIE